MKTNLGNVAANSMLDTIIRNEGLPASLFNVHSIEAPSEVRVGDPSYVVRAVVGAKPDFAAYLNDYIKSEYGKKLLVDCKQTPRFSLARLLLQLSIFGVRPTTHVSEGVIDSNDICGITSTTFQAFSNGPSYMFLESDEGFNIFEEPATFMFNENACAARPQRFGSKHKGEWDLYAMVEKPYSSATPRSAIKVFRAGRNTRTKINVVD